MIITNDMRGRINHALLKHAYADTLRAFLAVETPLVLDVHVAAYEPSVRQAMELLAAKHDGSIPRRSSATVNAGGQRITIGAGGRNDGRGEMQDILPEHDSPSILVIDPHRYDNSVMLAVNADDVMAKRVLAYAADRERLNAEIKTRRAEIAGVLSEIRTDRQLRERWPEAVPLAAPILKIEPKAQLPMVPLDGLNAALGLPPSTEDADHAPQ